MSEWSALHIVSRKTPANMPWSERLEFLQANNESVAERAGVRLLNPQSPRIAITPLEPGPNGWDVCQDEDALADRIRFTYEAEPVTDEARADLDRARGSARR